MADTNTSAIQLIEKAMLEAGLGVIKGMCEFEAVSSTEAAQLTGHVGSLIGQSAPDETLKSIEVNKSIPYAGDLAEEGDIADEDHLSRKSFAKELTKSLMRGDWRPVDKSLGDEMKVEALAKHYLINFPEFSPEEALELAMQTYLELGV